MRRNIDRYSSGDDRNDGTATVYDAEVTADDFDVERDT